MTRRALHHCLVFGVLFTLWVILSGKLDATHLGMGVFSAALVTVISGRHLHSDDGHGGPGFSLALLRWHRVLLYLPWLGWEIVKANLHVLKLVLGPRDRWNPRVITFDPGLRAELSQVVLANSITLTPGTVTLDVIDTAFVVHAIDAVVADDLEEGGMARRVARTFEVGGDRGAGP